MIKIMWQDWAYNLTWEYSTQFWIQSLTLKLIPDKGPSAIAGSLPFPGPHDYTWLCHHSLYQNTFSKNLCKWLSFWFQCIFGTHSCYRHPHLSYLQKMDCYHQEGGLQKHWLTLREKLFCTAGPVVSVPKGNSGHNCMNPWLRNSPHKQQLLQTHLVQTNCLNSATTNSPHIKNVFGQN